MIQCKIFKIHKRIALSVYNNSRWYTFFCYKIIKNNEICYTFIINEKLFSSKMDLDNIEQIKKYLLENEFISQVISNKYNLNKFKLTRKFLLSII